MTVLGVFLIAALVLLAIPGFAPWLVGWESGRLWRQLKVAGVVHKCPVCRVEFIRRTEPKDVCPKCGTRTKGVSA